MKEGDKENSIEVLITNILLDIDRSLDRKISECKLDLATFNSKEKTLEYIELEKLTIRKSLKETPYKNRTSIDKYLKYLQQYPLDVTLRRSAIEDFVNTCIILYGHDESTKFFFNSFNYRKQRKIEIVKSIVDRATLLEFNSFLTDEINKIKKENSNRLDSYSDPNENKLEWKGTQTELIELIKALIENGNIKGVQKDIINNFTVFFGVEIKNPNKLIQDLKKRNNQSETLFLDKLKSKLLAYLKKK